MQLLPTKEHMAQTTVSNSKQKSLPHCGSDLTGRYPGISSRCSSLPWQTWEQSPEQNTYVTSDRFFFLSPSSFSLPSPLLSFYSLSQSSFYTQHSGHMTKSVFCMNGSKAIVYNSILNFVRTQVTDSATLSTDYIRVKCERTCIAWW